MKKLTLCFLFCISIIMGSAPLAGASCVCEVGNDGASIITNNFPQSEPLPRQVSVEEPSGELLEYFWVILAILFFGELILSPKTLIARIERGGSSYC